MKVSVILAMFILVCSSLEAEESKLNNDKNQSVGSIPAHSTLASPTLISVALTLEQAAKQVLGSHSGSRMLSARTEEVDGRKVHVIKTLSTEGRIQQQILDADSGIQMEIGEELNESAKVNGDSSTTMDPNFEEAK